MEQHTPIADPRPAARAAFDLAASTIDAVQPVQLTGPTPCGEMDVRLLLRHLVMVAERIGSAGRGLPPMEWSSGPTELADDDVPAAFRSAADDALAAWGDDSVLDRPTDVPWGTFSGALTLATYVNELTVHTWDLATATGQRPAFDPEVLTISFDAIRAQLPDAERGPMWDAAKTMVPQNVPWADPFGDAVPVADDAPLLDRLVAWNGRRP